METLEQLQTRHRKEQCDLQTRITQKKKGATKKTRKGVNAQCDVLERALTEKQEQELALLNGDSAAISNKSPKLNPEPADETAHSFAPDDSAKVAMNGIAEELQMTALSDTSKFGEGEGRKRNRQKERLARRAAEKETAALEAEAEASKLPNWKRQEQTAMLKAFRKYGLVEKEIAPDGHCLFSAIADQLSGIGIPLCQGVELQGMDQNYRAVRKAAASYIEEHPGEFAAFLDESLDSYVHKIRDTAEWGGQLELIALAKSYNITICIIQDGRLDQFEPSNDSMQDSDKIWLAYYHYSYGLGEHYNSLRKAL